MPRVPRRSLNGRRRQVRATPGRREAPTWSDVDALLLDKLSDALLSDRQKTVEVTNLLSEDAQGGRERQRRSAPVGGLASDGATNVEVGGQPCRKPGQ